MFELAKAIFGGRSAAAGSAGADAALLDRAVERVVAGTDPRLRAVGGYKRKLRESVARSVDHARAVAEEFHPAVEMRRERYVLDPQVWGFFGAADRIAEVLGTSRVLKEFWQRSASAPLTELYAGMATVYEEKSVLAPARRGDVVERDVMQTAVNFSAHRIGVPGASEADVRQAIVERAFMHLVECALERLVSIRDRKSQLESARALLSRKLRTLKARSLGMQPFDDTGPASSPDLGELERRLVAVEAELRETAASIATLDESLEQVVGVMGSPSEHLRFTRTSARMTRMGFKASVEDADPGEEIFFTRMELGPSRTYAGRLIRVPRSS